MNALLFGIRLGLMVLGFPSRAGVELFILDDESGEFFVAILLGLDIRDTGDLEREKIITVNYV